MRNVAFYKAKFSDIKRCIFFMTFFIPAISFSQTRGKVEVVKDARIDTFAARRLELNRTGGADAANINGYRVQIFTGENRKDAYSAQAKFQEEFPDIRTYIIYNEPNFKVRAGDFRTRLEAEKLEEELKKWFTGMFIIPEKINSPKLDSTNE
jgi:hypothetical protein